MPFRMFLLLTMTLALPATLVGAAEKPPGLTLRAALTRGLEHNLELRIAAAETPLSETRLTAAAAAFDPRLEMEAETAAERLPTASLFTRDRYERMREYVGWAALSKRFRTGLEGSLSFETWRQTTNSLVTGLDPEYRSFLVLDLVQPLLRDGGRRANTTDLRIARQRRQQAGLEFLNQARILAGRIEQAYLELARSQAELALRLDARALAEDLLAGNRRKFETGLVAVSEVQEAETAVAARDEEILLARQRAELAVNQLRDLLELEQLDPLAVAWRGDAAAVEPGDRLERREALALALDNRPDLEAQRVELEIRDIRVAFADNQLLPRLDLAATLGSNGLAGSAQETTFAGSGTGPNLFRGGYEESVAGMAETEGYEWRVGLMFSRPLGNRAAEARLSRSKLEQRQEIDRLHRLENSVATEIDDALTVVGRSLQRVTVAGRFVTLAETTLEQEMERLAAGLSDTFRVLDFQAELIDARVRRINALTEAAIGQADLYAAVGLNLERHGILPQLPATAGGFGRADEPEPAQAAPQMRW